MKKITNWFRGQSKQSRIVFLIAVAGYLVLAARSITSAGVSSRALGELLPRLLFPTHFI